MHITLSLLSGVHNKVLLLLYCDNYCYRDNFVVHYRDTDFSIIAQP